MIIFFLEHSMFSNWVFMQIGAYTFATQLEKSFLKHELEATFRKLIGIFGWRMSIGIAWQQLKNTKFVRKKKQIEHLSMLNTEAFKHSNILKRNKSWKIEKKKKPPNAWNRKSNYKNYCYRTKSIIYYWNLKFLVLWHWIKATGVMRCIKNHHAIPIQCVVSIFISQPFDSFWKRYSVVLYSA